MAVKTLDDQAIFEVARKISSPQARQAYLAQICGADLATVERIEALLRAHDDSASFLEYPPPGIGVSPTINQPAQEKPGTQIGPYKLLQQIGEGGMGTVYMAEQKEPVQRKVALKLIKPGMDSRPVIARFEAERQALAVMDHVNIARVLDAGTTEQGRPYFVMELVHGVPITKYCDDNRLTPRQRLELFVPVCQAIQHAHQKGIIHRDIKPSNVMVTLYDGKPVPKVIDFGVAKATEQRLTERTLFTQYGTMVGTLEYMSPEQAEMSALGADTRSDIYSLGVLLYELLTGNTPLTHTRMKEVAYAEILRLIKEEEPPKPSTRLSESGESLASISAQRHTEPAKLSKLMRGELDWIVMKTLEKDRNRRYETAKDFAVDVQRYLSDEPVLACPPSAWYRFRKFARKYKVALATSALVGIALIGALVVLGVSNVWVARERDEKDKALKDKGEALQKESVALEKSKEQEGLANKQQKIAEAEAVRAQQQERTARFNLYTARLKLVEHNLEVGRTGRALALLEADRPRPGQDDLRGFEWYFLWRQVHHGHRFTLRGHQDAVQSLAFSPDGTTLASASLDSTVRVWHAATGQVRTTLNHSDRVWAVAFSPDGDTLASGVADQTVTLWHLPTGKPRSKLRGPDEIRCVAFSPDGKTLASAGAAGSLLLWNLSTGDVQMNLQQPKTVRSLAFSPDGKTLATITTYGDGKVWDVATGKEQATFRGHRWGSFAVAFSPDGKTLASAGSQSVKLLDPNTGQERTSLSGQTSYVNALAFSPNGELVALGSLNGDVTLWNPATGQTRTYGHAVGPVLAVTFSPDGKILASAGADKAVKLWNVSLEPEPSILQTGGCVWTVAVSPDSKIIATGGDGGVKLWDMLTARETATIPGAGVALSLAFSPDGNTMASGNPSLQLWDVTTRQERATLGGRRSIWCVTFSPDGKTLASATHDGTVELWDVVLRQNRATISHQTNPVSEQRRSDHWVYSVAFSPDGKILASGGYGSGRNLKLWDVATGKERVAIAGHDGTNINSVIFSPDGTTVISGRGRDGAMMVWDVATGRELASLMGSSGLPNSGGMALLPDRKTLATGTFEGSLKLWDLPTGHERAALKGHTLQVSSVAASSDGKVVVSGSYDGTVKIWRAATEEEVLAQSCVLDYRAGLAGGHAIEKKE